MLGNGKVNKDSGPRRRSVETTVAVVTIDTPLGNGTGVIIETSGETGIGRSNKLSVYPNQEDKVEKRRGMVLLDVATWGGRLMGLLVIVIALALGAKVAADSNRDEFWNFLATIVTPLGLGFLILVAAEIVNRLGREPQ